MEKISDKITLDRIDSDLLSTDPDKRWEAASLLSEYVECFPNEIWDIIVKYGSSNNEGLRQAIASCALEHVLEYHFDEFFPKLESLIKIDSNNNLKETLRLCWKLGDAEKSDNSSRWDNLLDSTTYT